MDGLSGMKVYQTFNIDSEFLPTNYPGTLLFLIKGITNKIENNQWTTTIESMCVAKNPFAATGSDNPVDEASRTANRGVVGDYYKGASTTTLNESVSFLTDVLKGLGISNPNSYQIQFIKSWRQHEGGKAAWNPFNTTQRAAGAQTYNYANVKNYPDRVTGLKATIDTLNNGRYTEVINAIKNIRDENGISKAMQAVNNSPWGSKFNPPVASAWKTFNNLIYKEPFVKKS
jgi:hypothetical protein